MARNYKTAQGKILDMASLVAKNEKVRAVGNMKVNARGDTIDPSGKIIVPVTQKVGEKYQKTVGNKSAHATKQPKQPAAKQPAVKEALTQDELELETFDDIDIEAIKAKESKK